MDKLSRRLTSISTKQRFGEILALVLIVGLMGLLVYLMIPTHTEAPKVAPVTVRSNTSVALQQHTQSPTYQAPVTSDKVSQASDITAKGSAPKNTAPEHRVESNYASHSSINKFAVQAPQVAKTVQGIQPSKGTTCASVTKPLDATLLRVGSALHLTSLVAGIAPVTSSCQS